MQREAGREEHETNWEVTPKQLSMNPEMASSDETEYPVLSDNAGSGGR